MNVHHERPPPASSATPHGFGLTIDELEAVFDAWVNDPAKPDTVDIGPDEQLAVADLLRRLQGSQRRLVPPAGERIGLPGDVTVATAATELLHATVDPDGPRCRSFRAASYYLRGLAHLNDDPDDDPDDPRPVTASVNGHRDEHRVSDAVAPPAGRTMTMIGALRAKG